jgi:hypothetical protein
MVYLDERAVPSLRISPSPGVGVATDGRAATFPGQGWALRDRATPTPVERHPLSDFIQPPTPPAE